MPLIEKLYLTICKLENWFFRSYLIFYPAFCIIQGNQRQAMTSCVVYVIHTRHLLMYRELKVDFNVLTRERETEQAKYFEVFEVLRVYPREDRTSVTHVISPISFKLLRGLISYSRIQRCFGFPANPWGIWALTSNP